MQGIQAEKLDLRELRINLGLNQSQLAREANITRITAASAEKGRSISPNTAKAITDAINRRGNTSYKVTDLKLTIK